MKKKNRSVKKIGGTLKNNTKTNQKEFLMGQIRDSLSIKINTRVINYEYGK